MMVLSLYGRVLGKPTAIPPKFLQGFPQGVPNPTVTAETAMFPTFFFNFFPVYYY